VVFSSLYELGEKVVKKRSCGIGLNSVLYFRALYAYDALSLAFKFEACEVISAMK
jgi:hypothetical protein